MLKIKDLEGNVINMCAKIEELSGLSANDILKVFNADNLIPVDISQICYDLQIRVTGANFEKIENMVYSNEVKMKGHILGAVMVQDDDIAILYRKSDSKNRIRFTLAHELAHCCLHMKPEDEIHVEFRTDEQSNSPKEIEANVFAGELLIPEQCLKAVLKDQKTIDVNMVELLSDMFVVSNNVMKERLKNLNYQIKGN